MTDRYPVDEVVTDRQGGWAGPRFGPALGVVRTLVSGGHRAVFVGGAVRDLLLGRPVGDVDVATDAGPDRVEELFDKTVAVGKQFGVIVVPVGGQQVEVATFRQDRNYLDCRRPEGYVPADEAGDVSRRDFTINTLVIDPLADELVDHEGGLADLRAGLVRCVGEPARRFGEDHLRVLRGLRFAARLGFRLEEATFAAMRGHPLGGVSPERILDELRKGLADPGRRRWGELLLEIDALPACVPPAAPADAARRAAWPPALGRLPANAPWTVALAALAVVAGVEPASWRAWTEDWPFNRADRKRLRALLEETPAGYLAAREARRRELAVTKLGDDLTLLWEALEEAEALAALAERRAAGRTSPERLLSGEDCRAAGLAGPAIGAALTECTALQWEETILTRDEALAWLADRTDKTPG